MKRRYGFLLVILWGALLLFTACEDELPTEVKFRELAIDSVEVFRNVERNILRIQARILPATGAPIDSVWFKGYQPGADTASVEAVLYDDGTHDDVIPFNGWYSGATPAGFLVPYLPPDSSLQFRFEVFVRDSLNTDKSRIKTYTLPYNYPADIFEVAAPETLNAAVSELGLVRAAVRDSNGINDIKQVYLQQYAKEVNGDTLQSPGRITPLSNRGDFEQTGDATAGDSVYSVIVRTAPSLEPGARFMRIVAEDYSRAKDTSYVTIYIENQ
ncbi:MAG: hypothetical protein K9N46_12300 [Candidatus Marinimicrobia bacterium]|nr:hypothetical protein [Candidatus Neomarinimicrobiota bacterium]MCF7829089.1 hypothetical protein [Candidatus Neomarinimicrobiota bacterium]MCF7881512.1 hypothetical protein [Candidatus Neomarinimicrobiota bacterium]